MDFGGILGSISPLAMPAKSFSAAADLQDHFLNTRFWLFFLGDLLRFVVAFIISAWNKVRCLFQTNFSGKRATEYAHNYFILNACQSWKAHACVKQCTWNMLLATLFNAFQDHRGYDMHMLKNLSETMAGAFVWPACDQKAKCFSHRLIAQ